MLFTPPHHPPPLTSQPLPLTGRVLCIRAGDVCAACLVRWAQEARIDADALLDQLRHRYLAALEAYPNMPAAADQGPGDEQAGGPGAAASGSTSMATAGSSSSSGGGASSSNSLCNSGISGSGSLGDDEPWASLRPRGRTADAINSSTVAVRIASTYPQAMTQMALQRAGIACTTSSSSCSKESGGGGSRASSSSLSTSGTIVLQVPSLELAAMDVAAQATAAGSELHVVVDRLGRAERLRELLLQPVPAAAAAAAAAAASTSAGAGAAAAPAPARGSAERAQRQQKQQRPAVHVYVAEYCCSTASQRAAAGVGLLSEHRLAELLGCGDSPLVMDGVAWR